VRRRKAPILLNLTSGGVSGTRITNGRPHERS
jgi:hypothetical protein